MKRLITFFALALLVMGAQSLQASNFPWPHNVGYAFGQKPTIGGSDAATILGYWNSWKSAHIVADSNNGCSNCKRVNVTESTDLHYNGTVSEGISYGMILAVYFDDQADFDAMWNYKQNHNDNLGLMNWWINNSGGTAGANSAADADQDITYALFLAYYQWGTASSIVSGSPSYKTLANAELAKITAYDINSQRVNPGDSFSSCRYPSYFFPNEYKVFGKQSGDTATWNAVASNCFATIAAARNSSTGILGEQCTDTGQGGGCQASDPPTQDKYNSSRVPLRMATDYVYYGDSAASAELTLLSGNNGFGGIAASSVVDCYNVSGSPLSSAGCGSYNSGAFMGPAGTTFMLASASTTTLNNYYSWMLSQNYSSKYFDGAIWLMSLLLISGNMPNIGDQAAMYTASPTQTPGGPTVTASPTATPMSFAYVFEDAEHAFIVNDYDFAGPAGTPSVPTPVISYKVESYTAQAPQYGAYGVYCNVTMGSGTYCGLGFDSSYAPATTGVLNFTGAVTMRFAVLSDKAIGFTPMFKEGTVSGGDGEVWKSSVAFTIGASQLNTWQVFTVPLTVGPTGLTLNAYAGNQTGNKVVNLSSVQTVEFDFASSTGANVFFDNIDFVPGVVPTLTPTKTPFPNPYTIIYEDFESPNSMTAAPKRLTSFADTANGASAALALDTANYVAGVKSAKLSYTLGTAGKSFGCGGSVVSPYGTVNWNSQSAITGTAFDASNSVSLDYWIKGDAGLVYQMTYQEAGTTTTAVGASDGEGWYSNYMVASGSWQHVTIDIGSMAEDPYNTSCNPTGLAAPGPCLSGAQAGNNTPNLNAVWQVGIKVPGQQVGVANRTSALWLDNINFITTYRSPTVTPSFTGGAGTATNTATPTPSMSSTPTATGTGTPSGTPTATDSPSATPTATPSASPSSTRTGTPTPTPSPTASDTGTSVPPGSSPTDTFTIAPTATVTPSFTGTASSTASPTPTPSFTVAVGSATATPTVTDTVGLPTSTNTPNPSFTGSPTASPSYTSSLQSPTDTPTPAVPVVTGLSPNPIDASGGTLTISGSNLLSGLTVTINGVTVPATVVNSNTVTVNVPAEAPGTTVPVQVTNPDGTPAVVQSLSIKNATFTITPTDSPSFTATRTDSVTATLTVTPSASPSNTPQPSQSTTVGTTAPAPVVQTVSPSSALAGDVVTLTGTNFQNGATVSFPGLSNPVATTFQSSSSVTFVMPTLPSQASVLFTLKNPDGQNTQASMGVKATATPGSQVIVTTQPVPNPGTTGHPPQVGVLLGLGADSVSLRIYGQSMAMVAKGVPVGAGPYAPGWVKIQVPNLSAGVYYYTVSATRNGTTVKAPKVGRLVILQK